MKAIPGTEWGEKWRNPRDATELIPGPPKRPCFSGNKNCRPGSKPRHTSQARRRAKYDKHEQCLKAILRRTGLCTGQRLAWIRTELDAVGIAHREVRRSDVRSGEVGEARQGSAMWRCEVGWVEARRLEAA